MGKLRRTASWFLCLFLFSLPQFSLSSAGVGLENGVGLARPNMGGEDQHGRTPTNSIVAPPPLPLLSSMIFSLLPEIWLPNTTSNGKPEKPTKPSLKNPFLMPKICF
jgi:hypothetical protein